MSKEGFVLYPGSLKFMPLLASHLRLCLWRCTYTTCFWIKIL